MGFSVPPRLRLERWALTPPFHPYPALSESVRLDSELLRFQKERGGIFSVALSVRMPRGITSRVYPMNRFHRLRGIAPFGVRTFLPRLSPEAILRPSKIGSKYIAQPSRGKAKKLGHHENRPRHHSYS